MCYIESMSYKPELRMRKIRPDAVIPEYATEGAAGLDLRSIAEYNIPAGKYVLVKTGLAIEIPSGYVGDVRSRSGLAAKDGLMVLNSPGTIDSDYCGDMDEVGVILFNTGSVHENYKVNIGDRVAQLVLVPAPQFEIVEVESLGNKDRGGFGSTGK